MRLSAGPRAAGTALAALLAVVSWHSADALGRTSGLGGPVAAVGYALALVLALLVVGPWLTATLRRAPAGVLSALVAVLVAGLVVAFVVGVPPAYREALGVGSDRANALDVALSRLVEGRYPYAATTYLGNPITPLPGALLLAAPFWWLTGDAGWQNPAWLVGLLAVLHGRRPLRPEPTVLWAVVGVGGLEVLREFVVGDDLVTGAVPAVAVLAWTLRVVDGRSTAAVAIAGVALGVTTCTRPHLLLVLVVAVAAAGARAGWRRAAVVGACSGLAWAALIAPFLLGGIARFSPLHVAAKVTGERSVTAGMVMIALACLGLLVAGLWALRPWTPAQVGWWAAAVLVTPTVLSLAKGVLVGPASDIDLTLGAVAVPFAAWAAARSGWGATTTGEAVLRPAPPRPGARTGAAPARPERAGRPRGGGSRTAGARRPV